MGNDFPDDDDGNVLRNLVAGGSDLSREMKIDFMINVSDETIGIIIAQKMELKGFQVSVEKDETSQRWTCYCTRTMVPSYERLIGIQKMMNEIAKPYGGCSDGWGSFGNSDI